MTPTIAFDVYGTLIDTRSVEKALRLLVGQKSVAVSELWRQKQLEYSFRRGLMQEYRDFSVCTRDALLFACESNGVKLSTLEQEQAMHAYTELEAFDDVKDGLADLLSSKLRLFAFSNGSRTAIDALLRHATLRESFVGVLSVEEVRSFKPDPIVYETVKSTFLVVSQRLPKKADLARYPKFKGLGVSPWFWVWPVMP